MAPSVAAVEAKQESAVPASAAGSKKQPLHLLIDDVWVDVTHWASSHPGGEQVLRPLHGKDATDAFYALHSRDAFNRLAKLPKMAKCPVEKAPETSSLSRNFRKFRAQLVKDGFFDREPLWELFYQAEVWGLAALGTYLAWSHPWLAVALIGLAMQQGGWVGHDLQHGRGDYCYYAGNLTAGIINCFSPTWWSAKHNTHHVYPNFDGVDTDIANDPIFHLWFPDPKKDYAIRRYQHLYFVPVVSFIYASWRMQSFLHAWANKHWGQLALMAIGYTWLACLPFKVALGSIMFGGWLVGIIVTATHQSEPLVDPSSVKEYDYVLHQFESTRNAVSPNPVTNWLWGGMQLQLEHHLFPIMPKYHLAAAVPLVKKFAKENGIEYKEENMIPILIRNINTMKHYAGALKQH